MNLFTFPCKGFYNLCITESFFGLGTYRLRQLSQLSDSELKECYF